MILLWGHKNQFGGYGSYFGGIKTNLWAMDPTLGGIKTNLWAMDPTLGATRRNLGALDNPILRITK